MKKILRVGDPHVMITNIKDSEALMDFVIETAKQEKVDCVELLGDLFHTHAVMRVEVVDFWRRVFEAFKANKVALRVLVGNHDQPGSREKEQVMNALDVFQSYGDADCLRTIINKPMIIDGIAYIPYMSNKEMFLNASKELYEAGATSLLVAHQTFTGATYDNGFYAEDGIDPELVSQDAIIAGHIHKNQQIGKCDYTGTAKWDTLSDANQDKGIWIYEHNDNMSVKNKKMISTKDVVTPIYKHVYEEGGEAPELTDNAKNYLELVGKSAWITKMKKKWKGRAQIKARPTDRRSPKVDFEGESLTIGEYAKSFDFVKDVNPDEVISYIGGL